MENTKLSNSLLLCTSVLASNAKGIGQSYSKQSIRSHPYVQLHSYEILNFTLNSWWVQTVQQLPVQCSSCYVLYLYPFEKNTHIRRNSNSVTLMHSFSNSAIESSGFELCRDCWKFHTEGCDHHDTGGCHCHRKYIWSFHRCFTMFHECFSMFHQCLTIGNRCIDNLLITTLATMQLHNLDLNMHKMTSHKKASIYFKVS